MPILNYRTRVSTDQTLAEIQRRLAVAGAQAVMTEYGAGGVVVAVAFRLNVHGTPISFKLPARVDKILAILKADTSPHIGRKERTWAFAEQVAWRIVKDWIEAQLALVEAEQAELLEVFLPYAQHPTSGQTMYQLAGALLALPKPEA